MKKTTKDLKNKRYTFRMTEREAEMLEEAAKILDCKPSYLARMGLSAVTQAMRENLQAI